MGLSTATHHGTSMHLIDLIEKELQTFRETGRAIHLAHAARALDEAMAVVGTLTTLKVRSTN